MSSSAAHIHNKRLSSETEHAQRVPDVDHVTQQLKLRERQRFFEEAFQHDVDVFLSSAHLQIDYKRPPIGSISSMEVNVDMLEQMDMMDISDQDTLDVFLTSEDTPPLSAHGINNNDNDDDNDDDNADDADDEVINSGLSRRDSDRKSRMSSTSSTSSSNSQSANEEDGHNTPVIQSDEDEEEEEEDVHCDAPLLLISSPPGEEENDRPITSS